MPMPRCRTSVFINTWSSHCFMILFIPSYCACCILLLFSGIFNSINCEKNA